MITLTIQEYRDFKNLIQKQAETSPELLKAIASTGRALRHMISSRQQEASTGSPSIMIPPHVVHLHPNTPSPAQQAKVSVWSCYVPFVSSFIDCLPFHQATY